MPVYRGIWKMAWDKTARQENDVFVDATDIELAISTARAQVSQGPPVEIVSLVVTDLTHVAQPKLYFAVDGHNPSSGRRIVALDGAEVSRLLPPGGRPVAAWHVFFLGAAPEGESAPSSQCVSSMCAASSSGPKDFEREVAAKCFHGVAGLSENARRFLEEQKQVVVGRSTATLEIVEFTLPLEGGGSCTAKEYRFSDGRAFRQVEQRSYCDSGLRNWGHFLTLVDRRGRPVPEADWDSEVMDRNADFYVA